MPGIYNQIEQWMLKSVKKNDLDRVLELLGMGAKMNTPEAQEALIYAASKGQAEILQVLINQPGVDLDRVINVSFLRTRKLIDFAAANGQDRCVKMILTTQALQKFGDSEYTRAAISGDLDKLNKLLTWNYAPPPLEDLQAALNAAEYSRQNFDVCGQIELAIARGYPEAARSYWQRFKAYFKLNNAFAHGYLGGLRISFRQANILQQYVAAIKKDHSLYVQPEAARSNRTSIIARLFLALRNALRKLANYFSPTPPPRLKLPWELDASRIVYYIPKRTYDAIEQKSPGLLKELMELFKTRSNELAQEIEDGYDPKKPETFKYYAVKVRDFEDDWNKLSSFAHDIKQFQVIIKTYLDRLENELAAIDVKTLESRPEQSDQAETTPQEITAPLLKKQPLKKHLLLFSSKSSHKHLSQQEIRRAKIQSLKTKASNL